MMIKFFLVIIYLIMLPIALGILSNYVLKRGNSLGERRFITKLLDDYVSGYIVMFFAFEVTGLYILTCVGSLTSFIEVMNSYINVFVIASFVVAIVVIVIAAILKGMKGGLVDELKTLRPIKSDIIVISFIVGYILLSVLFILPNSKDDTFLNIIIMQKEDVINTPVQVKRASFSDICFSTKLIEVFYIVISHVIGIDDVQLLRVILSIVLLVLFFGVYKRIEWIFFGYNKKLSRYKKWSEYLFMGICIVLLFIDGSLNVAVPQNIWNGTTILSSIIMPLGYIYGYAAICEVCNGKTIRVAIWLILVLFIFPVASIMSNNGYQNIAVLGLVVVVGVIISVIVNYVIGKNKG